VRPPAKTPLMIVGASSTLIGAGLYAASIPTRANFDQADTTSALLQYRTLTNSLVIASGITTALGLGVGYAGVMMGASPGVMIGGQF